MRGGAWFPEAVGATAEERPAGMREPARHLRVHGSGLRSVADHPGVTRTNLFVSGAAVGCGGPARSRPELPRTSKPLERAADDPERPQPGRSPRPPAPRTNSPRR